MAAQTPQEKAKEGLRLLQQAVVDYLTGRQSVRTTQARDELGLASAGGDGKWKDNLFWGLVLLLKKEDRVQTEKIGGRVYISLPTTEPNADPATQS